MLGSLRCVSWLGLGGDRVALVWWSVWGGDTVVFVGLGSLKLLASGGDVAGDRVGELSSTSFWLTVSAWA